MRFLKATVTLTRFTLRIGNWLPALTLILGTTVLLGAKEFELTRSQQEHMERVTEQAVRYLQYYHYSKEPITNINQDELLINYMEELDYSRLFFQQRDKEEILGRFGNTLIDSYFKKGRWLYPAFQVFQIYRDNALNRLEWVFDRLEGDFDFTTNETFVPDRSELDWPASREEADTLWEKRLTFDLLQELLNGETIERAKEKVERRYRRSQRYVEELEPSDVQEIFLTSLTQMYDPHSTFYSPDTLDDFTIAMRNSLVGIGALLRDEDGYCVIQELIPGGPAEMSNQFHPGDKIVEVAQEHEDPVDVIDMKLRKIVELIRGEKGTKVNLTLIPADASDPSERRHVTLVRDEIKLTENLASAAIHEVPVDDNKTISVGVIDLPSFYGSGEEGEDESSTTKDVEELLVKLKARGVDGVVLDLRRNGGGLLSEAIKLTGLFIPKGPVVQVRDTSGQVRQDWDRDPKVVYEGPLVVLVSRRSASASEIVAGALQNLDRAVIVGDASTHGKGTVQAVFELDRSIGFSLFKKESEEKMGATKITIQKFYLPNGDSTQEKGVVSDIALPSINDLLPIGESDLDYALLWDTIEPLHWNQADALVPNGAKVDKALLDYLREKSEARQSALEEFDYLKKNIDWFDKKQNQKEFSLNLELRKKQKDEDTHFRDEMEVVQEELSSDNFPVKDVLLDVSQEREKEHQEKLRHSLLPNGKGKANTYFHKVFYYQPDENSEIKEVWVESIDYEKALKYTSEIVDYISEKTGFELSEEKMEDLLHYFKSAETSDEYNVEQAWADRFGDQLDEAQIEDVIPVFFTKLVDVDSDVLNERPELDIPLRESLRVIVDWMKYEDDLMKQGVIATFTAASHKQESQETVTR